MIDADTQRDELVGRLFSAGLGMAEVLTVYLGDTLGLYRAIERAGSMTAPELAEARQGSSSDTRGSGSSSRPPPGSCPSTTCRRAPTHAGTSFRRVTSSRCSIPKARTRSRRSASRSSRCPASCRTLVAAFRSGGPVDWSAYGRDMVEAQGDFNRPWLVGSLGTEYLPSIPDIHARLMSDAGTRVADVACGVGWAAISLARAYPSITVDGFDLDASSIEIASRNADEAGVADRVHFEVRDAADPALEARYDLALVVEAIHDLSQPVAVLRSIRGMLKPGGTLIVADERTEDVVHGSRQRDRATLLRLQRPVLPAVRHGRRHVGGDRHGHAKDDLRGVREGGRVRRRLGPADRARLPSFLPTRSVTGAPVIEEVVRSVLRLVSTRGSDRYWMVLTPRARERRPQRHPAPRGRRR